MEKILIKIVIVPQKGGLLFKFSYNLPKSNCSFIGNVIKTWIVFTKRKVTLTIFYFSINFEF